MRIILKILAAPFVVVLTIFVAVITFLFCVAGAVCGVASIIVTLLAIVAFIAGQTTGGIACFVIAFLVSPFGILAIADWLIEKLHNLNFALRDFITG
ncbi:MAG: hypothetical protein EOM54_00095 [Clostridia bacterium]|nr:hypothetical protein [Clostridia bacterium]